MQKIHFGKFMRNIICTVLLSILLISCGGGVDNDVTNTDTSGATDTGSASGKIAFRQEDLPIANLQVSLTTKQLNTVFEMRNYSDNPRNVLIAESDVNGKYEFQFSAIPPGNYYLNIGYVLKNSQDYYDNPPAIMSFHSTTPEIQINKGQQTDIGTIVLYPGGFAKLSWSLSTSSDVSQGFNFTTSTNVPYEECDIWFDGDNDLLITRGDNITLLPNEPSGLSNYRFVPDTGFTSQIFIPYVQIGAPDYVKQFVVRTQLGTYAKVQFVGRGQISSNSGIFYKELQIMWFHQSDGSTEFEY